MAFRLPANLGIARQYQVASPVGVTTLEQSLPANSRVLIGLVFSERYTGFEEDCLRAEAALQGQPGLSMWPELDHFITPDENGEPIAWVSYQSSPVWWTWILIAVGGIFLLPIIGVLPAWIIDLMFPGFSETISTVVMLVVVGGLMFFLPKLLKPAEEE